MCTLQIVSHSLQMLYDPSHLRFRMGCSTWNNWFWLYCSTPPRVLIYKNVKYLTNVFAAGQIMPQLGALTH